MIRISKQDEHATVFIHLCKSTLLTACKKLHVASLFVHASLPVCTSLHHKSNCYWYGRSIQSWYVRILHMPAQLASAEICRRTVKTDVHAGWMRIQMCENTRRNSKDEIYGQQMLMAPN